MKGSLDPAFDRRSPADSTDNAVHETESSQQKIRRFGDKVVTKVRKARISAALLALLIVPLMAGCSHKLVAHNGDTTVNVYSNKEQFDKLQSLKSQSGSGGLGGLVGGIGESMLTKKIDNNTPVKVLSSDDEGAMIEVTDGPETGVQGYVAKDNLD